MNTTSQSKTNEQPSTKQIIEVMKEKHRKNHKFYYNLGLITAILLALDIVTIIGARIQALDHIAWIGIYVLIVATGFCFAVARNERDWFKYIDEWYESKKQEYARKYEVRENTTTKRMVQQE